MGLKCKSFAFLFLTLHASLSILGPEVTRKRQQLLDILREEDTPLNASQVHSRIRGMVDLATVYRGLNYLEKHRYLDSFVFECEDRGIERYYSLRKSQHEHYMHCEICHRFYVLHTCSIDQSFRQIEEDYGFHVEEHFITLKGICQDCYRKTKNQGVEVRESLGS